MQTKLNLSQIGMMETFISDAPDPNCHIKFFQRLKDIFHQESFAEIHKPDSKLRTYKHLKTKAGFESYIKIIPSEKERVALSKFPLSNPQLMIEKGRHMNIKRELRFCPLCPNAVEDEIHFLTVCKGFKEHRRKLFYKINETNRAFQYKSGLEKLKYLLTNKDSIRMTGKFIIQCNEMRKQFIVTLAFIRILLVMYLLFIFLYIFLYL